MEKQYKPVPDVEALRYKGTPDKPGVELGVGPYNLLEKI